MRKFRFIQKVHVQTKSEWEISFSAQYLEGLVHEVLSRVEVERGLFERCVKVLPRLQVGNVQGVAQGLDVRAEDHVAGAKEGLDAEAHLCAYL